MGIAFQEGAYAVSSEEAPQEDAEEKASQDAQEDPLAATSTG
jgi:hypothetical protein